ncbi:hypothetical protein M011DRAFT_172580 [Sporormia fimetaria CBS 119925]|uniref:Uncharacterized protein n=1 Tax=Sporormia fimetaria CBS 119925 TaxID=1340428 RepID=A0A6A6V5C8_9PLEO|nr:hypothetical protein M011DRAFT_172580 [Sporormia fimetaria CBS 119925]
MQYSMDSECSTAVTTTMANIARAIKHHNNIAKLHPDYARTLPSAVALLASMDLLEDMENMHGSGHINTSPATPMQFDMTHYQGGVVTPLTPNTSMFEVEHLRNEVQAVRTTSDINNRQIEEQRQIIAMLHEVNHTLQKKMEDLELRLHGMNSPVTEGSVATMPRFARPITQPMVNLSQPIPRRKAALAENENIKAFSAPATPRRHAIPRLRPSTSAVGNGDATSPTRDRTMRVRDGRVEKSPHHSTKRKVHTLNTILPHAMTVIPKVPLTEKEISVFFFNSLSRPVVANRLYARGWGPAKITDALNLHLGLDPPYLRNTCSVKCTTAFRRGKEKYGDDYEAQIRQTFRKATLAEATRLIEIQEDEGYQPCDIDILDLSKNIKRYPTLQDKADDCELQYSIFTRCVMYCQRTGTSCLLSEVHKLARKLEGPSTPEISPSDSDFSGIGAQFTPSEKDFADNLLSISSGSEMDVASQQARESDSQTLILHMGLAPSPME